MFRQNSMYNYSQQSRYIPIYMNQQPTQPNTQPAIQPPPQVEEPKIIENKIENKIEEPKVEKLNFLDKNELFEYMNTKFSKLDEALIHFKNEKYPVKEFTEVVEDKKDVGIEIQSDKKTNKLLGKKKKKMYVMVDDNLFTQVKEKYPNFPENKKNDIVIDNENNFFISTGKKKIPLTNVSALKLINKHLKKI